MRVGKQSVGDYLALGAQLKNTPGAILLDNFAGHVEFIQDDLLTDADRPAFQAWVRQTFSPMLQQLGYTAQSNEPPTERQKRAVLFDVLGNIGE